MPCHAMPCYAHLGRVVLQHQGRPQPRLHGRGLDLSQDGTQLRGRDEGGEGQHGTQLRDWVAGDGGALGAWHSQ